MAHVFDVDAIAPAEHGLAGVRAGGDAAAHGGIGELGEPGALELAQVRAGRLRLEEAAPLKQALQPAGQVRGDPLDLPIAGRRQRMEADPSPLLV